MPDTTLTHETLGDLFEDVADAIREKNPDAPAENTMVADTFPTEIRNIPSGASVSNGIVYTYGGGGVSQNKVTKIKVYAETGSPIWDGNIPTRAFGTGDGISKDTIIEFEKPVTALGTKAFLGLGTRIERLGVYLTSYHAMEWALRWFNANSHNITTISNEAFAMYSDLYSQTVPTGNQVDVVFNAQVSGGDWHTMFANNPYIKSFTIGEQGSIDILPSNVFYYCYNLASITIPNDIEIHEDACRQARGLTKVRFVEPNTPSTRTLTINGYWLRNVYADTVDIEFVNALDKLPTIDANAFTSSAIKKIYVPWSEGAVAGAPWGADASKIVYDWTPTP